MKIKCERCGLPITIADSIQGKIEEDPQFCNHCDAHAEGEASEKFGCKYLGNNMWDCGYMDDE